MANLEVDDVHARSSPHSCYIKAQAGTGAEFGRLSQSFTNDEVVMWIYVPGTGANSYLALQKTDSAYDGTIQILTLRFEITTGDIEYYNGTAWVDTGYNISLGSFVELKVLPNFVTKTLDVWYDGTKIMDGIDFRDNTATSVEAIEFGSDQAGEWWVDDIQIGEAAAVKIVPPNAGPMCGINA